MFAFKSESAEQMKQRIRSQINKDNILALTQHSFKEANANKDSNTIDANFTRSYSTFNYQGKYYVICYFFINNLYYIEKRIK